VTIREILLAAGLCCTITGCASEVDLQRERQSLLQADSAWAAAAAAGDIESLATYWAEDAVNYFPGAPVASGRESILELVARNRSIPGFSLTWSATEAHVAEAADLGYTTGPFQLTTSNPEGISVTRSGHYVAIWRRSVEGGWECIVESTIFGPELGSGSAG